MMIDDFSKLLNLRAMDNGSKRHVLNKMSAPVQRLGDARLARLHQVALAGADATSQVNLRWLNQKELSETARRETRAIDAQVDRQLSSLHALLKTWADLPAQTAASAQAQRVLDALFIRGVFPYTSLPFDEEHDQVNTLISVMRSDFSAELGALNLDPVLDGLEQLNDEYGLALGRDIEKVSFEKVREVREDADQAFHKFLLALVGELVDQPDALSEILEPLRLQQKRLAEYYKRHKEPPAVDPDSGEPIGPEDADLHDPDAAAALAMSAIPESDSP